MPNHNNHRLDSSKIKEQRKNSSMSDNFKGFYEKRYLQVLDSAVIEAEKLLKDAKNLLQNRP